MTEWLSDQAGLGETETSVNTYFSLSFLRTPFQRTFLFHGQRLSLSPCSSSLTSPHVSFTDAASLCYNSTVKKPASGPWSHEVIGQLNKKCFIYCNNTNNCYPNGVLGNRLSATKIWGTQVETLRDLSDLFKQQMIHMKQENYTIRGKIQMAP